MPHHVASHDAASHAAPAAVGCMRLSDSVRLGVRSVYAPRDANVSEAKRAPGVPARPPTEAHMLFTKRLNLQLVFIRTAAGPSTHVARYTNHRNTRRAASAVRSETHYTGRRDP